MHTMHFDQIHPLYYTFLPLPAFLKGFIDLFSCMYIKYFGHIHTHPLLLPSLLVLVSVSFPPPPPLLYPPTLPTPHPATPPLATHTELTANNLLFIVLRENMQYLSFWD
jgi:hypothetical protein